MGNPGVVDGYVEQLLVGDRTGSRTLLHRQVEAVEDTREVYFDVLWPAMEQVERLYRSNRINIAAEHMATRINRSLADQLQASLVRQAPNGRRIVITCADGEPEELGAQMCADLFEANGWHAYFVGGGVPNDEILSMVGQIRPHVLLIFGTQAQGVPGVRQLVDMIHEVGVNPDMNIMLSGGVFNRANDLWKEVNADLFARTAKEALRMADNAKPPNRPAKAPGAPKKRRRRRRPPLLAMATTAN